MGNNEIIVSIDIGTTKVAAIAGRLNETGKIQILGYSSTPSYGVQRGTVTNILDTVEAINKVIKELKEKVGLEVGEVFVGIAGQHIRSLQHNDSYIRANREEEISDEEIKNFINNMFKLAVPAGEKILHVIPQEFEIDKQPGMKPVGAYGSNVRADFHIIVGNITSAQNICKCIDKAGLTLIKNGLIVEPLASAEAVLTEDEMDAGVALVDMGGGTTDIAIFKDKIIRHTAVIPLGGNIITEDIKQGCTIIARQAEALKLKFGSALAENKSDDDRVSIPGVNGRNPREISLKNLANIIEARVEEILERVSYEIMISGYDKKLICGIVLTGGGSELKDIRLLTEYRTGMDCRIGKPNEHIDINGINDIISPKYATGVGLLLKGYKNMDPEDIIEIQPTTTRIKFPAFFKKGQKEKEKEKVEPTKEQTKVNKSQEVKEKPPKVKQVKDNPGGLFDTIFGDNNYQ
ncbi:MAG: cell division protein FtsA [Bacteroidales bacterium]|nr:cell division protein FtsA [Bacteroidales bacterium]